MSRSRRVVCFCGDVAHERFIQEIIHRAAERKGTAVDIQMRNATHGSRVWTELRQYLREVKVFPQPLPDVLVVVADGNCKAARVRSEIDQEVRRVFPTKPDLVCAVPDLHIERWYLEDQRALKKVIRNAKPRKLSYKCDRDRYKQALKDAIRAAGIEPALGGAEYGEAIARNLDPRRLDASFRTFWRGILSAFS